jgi:molybdopterin adenylyltransferase
MSGPYQVFFLLWDGNDETAAALGETARAILEPAGCAVAGVTVLPRDSAAWTCALAVNPHRTGARCILTVGGAGFPAGEIVPDLTAAILSRPIPGIPEAIREAGAAAGAGAATALFRGTAGLTDEGNLVINLPSEPAWLAASLMIVARIAPHALDKAGGDPRDCGRA